MDTCFREVGLGGWAVNLVVGTVHVACSVAAVTAEVDLLSWPRSRSSCFVL